MVEVVSPDGVAPSRMVTVSASVNLPLHHTRSSLLAPDQLKLHVLMFILVLFLRPLFLNIRPYRPALTMVMMMIIVMMCDGLHVVPSGRDAAYSEPIR